MATLEQIEAALRAADAAGNTDDARRLAQAYSEVRAAQGKAGSAQASPAPHADDVPFASGRSPLTMDDLMPSAMAPERDKSIGERAQEAARGATLAVRSLGRGAASVPDLIAAPLAYGINKGLDAAGVDPSNHQMTGSEIFDAGWNKLGLPVPESTAERYVDRAGQGLGGAIGGTGLGNVLAGSASPVVSGLGQTMAGSRVAQGVGAVTSGLAGQLAHESNLGPWAELGAGLAGGLAPAVPALGLAALRGAVRGGEAGRQRVDQAVSDFATAGTTPTAGQATGLARMQMLESTLGRTPGAAGIIARKAQDQAGEIQTGLAGLASQLAPKAEPAQAGLAVERGITGPGGFVDRFKAKSGQLYDQLDQYLPAGTRVGTSNTAKALDELASTIPEARNLGERFVSGDVRNIKQAFDEDTRGPMAGFNRPDVVSEVQRRQFEAADQNAAIDRQNVLRSALGMKPKASVDPNDDIASLLDSATDGRLPYEALKKLRTEVGERAAQPNLASDVKSSAWKKLYAGISADMEAAAQQAGPEAQQAWTRANNYFRAGNGRIEALDRVVDKAGGPEAVFNAATSGSKDGAFTIRRVMQSLDQDQRQILSSTVLRRLGTATPGTATESGEFSINSFLTNWNKLSPDAKGALFDRYGKTFRDDVDAIARTAGTFRQASRNGANPSGTAQAAANLSALVGLASAVGTGHYGTAGLIAGGATGANLLARSMTNPAFVKFLATSSRIPTSQWPAVLSSLEQTAGSRGDEDTKKMVRSMREALEQNQENQSGN